ncbi:hypothetical protein D9758_019004 [Tetrapyrgos nigripes]|uniref:Uncharacterized protein n=1 Tax=Tetrapyrgos nigripes TaxID=182062 RepID=A0A8H5AUR7_9AGAR|nr:hypothetical protein D9758_019004 [Tetrapyrgos nigripes]
MRALHLAQNWIDKHDKPSIDIWKDTINFCRSFTSSEMCKSTPHLYVSALSTWDPQSHVSKHWQPRFPNIPKVSAAHSSAILMHIATKSPVHCVAISPNGGQIVSGGMMGLSVCGMQQVESSSRSSQGTQVGLGLLHFSPKGDQIVSGGEDSSVGVWDAASGEQLKKLTGHSGWVQSVAFSPKGDQIVSGGSNSSVCVWDAASGEQLKELTGHSGWVRKWRAAQGAHRALRKWRAAQEAHRALRLGSVCCIFTKGGSDCVWGGRLFLCVWDAASGEQLKSSRALRSDQSVAFSPKGDQIVSGGKTLLACWDAASGELKLRAQVRLLIWVMCPEEDCLCMYGMPQVSSLLSFTEGE